MDEEKIGNYRIEKKLGEGGAGEVFRAVDTRLNRVVAIKRLRPELARRTPIVERFRSEARTLAQLNHLNIATLYNLEQAGDSLLMVIEYVEGETLQELLQRERAMAPGPAAQLLVQALDGIGHAHRQGIVHRDIKGPNLMLRSDGVLKVMDFGIASVVGSEHVTQLGQIVGTPEFMSPEQMRGEDTDARSDVYSLGILFYALLTGRIPFVASNTYDLMKAQVEQEPPRICDAAPHLPSVFDGILLQALAKDPAQRFQTADDFRAAIAPFLERRRSEARSSPPPPLSVEPGVVDVGPTLVEAAELADEDDDDLEAVTQEMTDGDPIPVPSWSAVESDVAATAPARSLLPVALVLDKIDSGRPVRWQTLVWPVALTAAALLLTGLGVAWNDMRPHSSPEPRVLARQDELALDFSPISDERSPWPTPALTQNLTPSADLTRSIPVEVGESPPQAEKALGATVAAAESGKSVVVKARTKRRDRAPHEAPPASPAPGPEEADGWTIRR